MTAADHDDSAVPGMPATGEVIGSLHCRPEQAPGPFVRAKSADEIPDEAAAHSRPPTFVLSAGQAGDAPAFAHVVARLRVRQAPRTAPHRTGRGADRRGVLLPRDPRALAQARDPGGHPRSG
ncbi:hypothetical protein [Streptomyces litmocidini]|uniref:hypothetical protein n=1 Tax=Streptomyces litmocidini TaxID=67318 RepID=UPI00167EE1C3